MKKRKRRSQGGRVYICPFCLRGFNTIKGLIDHQDMTGHVIDIPIKEN